MENIFDFSGILRAIIVLTLVIPSHFAPVNKKGSKITSTEGIIDYCSGDEDMDYAMKHDTEMLFDNKIDINDLQRAMKNVHRKLKNVDDHTQACDFRKWKDVTYEEIPRVMFDHFFQNTKNATWFENCIRCWDVKSHKKDMTLLRSIDRGLHYFHKAFESLISVDLSKLIVAKHIEGQNERRRYLSELLTEIKLLKHEVREAMIEYGMEENIQYPVIDLQMDLTPNDTDFLVQDSKILTQCEEFIHDWHHIFKSVHKKKNGQLCLKKQRKGSRKDDNHPPNNDNNDDSTDDEMDKSEYR